VTAPVDFRAFVANIAASAASLLSAATTAASDEADSRGADGGSGERPDPRAHLMMARQLIDTLIMLEGKTRGNLDKEEADFLAKALNDLRLAYVKTNDGIGT